MGRESTVTFEQIAAVADAMKVEDVKPTSRAVRERLGNTGSMGTINKLLGRWKSGQTRQISAALVLPAGLQRVLLEFIDAELTAARATLEAELADQQQEALDLATENERQVIENESQTQAIESLQAEVSKHEGRAGQLESDLAVSRDEAARERSGAELARTELAKAQLRLEAMPRLEADLVAVRGVLDAERAARQQAEQQAAVLAAKLEAAERRATEADARTTKAEAATAQAVEKAEREMVTANAKLEAAERRADALTHDLASINTALHASQARLEAATRDLLEQRMADELSGKNDKRQGAKAPSAKQYKSEQGDLKL